MVRITRQSLVTSRFIYFKDLKSMGLFKRKKDKSAKKKNKKEKAGKAAPSDVVETPADEDPPEAVSEETEAVEESVPAPKKKKGLFKRKDKAAKKPKKEEEAPALEKAPEPPVEKEGIFLPLGEAVEDRDVKEETPQKPAKKKKGLFKRKDKAAKKPKKEEEVTTLEEEPEVPLEEEEADAPLAEDIKVIEEEDSGEETPQEPVKEKKGWFKRKKKKAKGEEEPPVSEEEAAETSEPLEESEESQEEEPQEELEAAAKEDLEEAETSKKAKDPRDKKGLFKRLKSGLSKTRDILTTDIDELFLGNRKLDDDLLDEIEELLITSDMGVQTSIALIDKLRKKASKIPDAEALKEVLKAEICELMGDGKVSEIDMEANHPHVIMVVGVNGVGKTTTIGKLAANFAAEGKSVLLAAADTFRAAAVEQLTIWSERSEAEIVRHRENADPAAVAFDAVEAAIARDKDIVIVDTAGRLHTKVNLMEELKKIRRAVAKRCLTRRMRHGWFWTRPQDKMPCPRPSYFMRLWASTV